MLCEALVQRTGTMGFQRSQRCHQAEVLKWNVHFRMVLESIWSSQMPCGQARIRKLLEIPRPLSQAGVRMASGGQRSTV